MTDEEYEETQSQILMLCSLIRMLPLQAFVERSNRALSIGPLLAPSHYIAGAEKLELVARLAGKLRAVQVALPTEEQAREMDASAARLRRQLGV